MILLLATTLGTERRIDLPAIVCWNAGKIYRGIEDLAAFALRWKRQILSLTLYIEGHIVLFRSRGSSPRIL